MKLFIVVYKDWEIEYLDLSNENWKYVNDNNTTNEK